MTSRKLIESLVTCVRASPIHKNIRIYVHRTDSEGFWKAIFISDDLTLSQNADLIDRIATFNKHLESLFGGAEGSDVRMHYGNKAECILEVQ